MRKLSGERFDWLAFLVRIAVVLAVATWLLIEMNRRRQHSAALFVAAIGYVVLPAAVYLHTRHLNSRFIGWIVDTVRARIGGRRNAG